MSEGAPRAIRQPVVLVSGLSGAGKSSVLRALEDVGFEAIDNAPLSLVETLVAQASAEPGTVRRVAVGVDARTRGFEGDAVLVTLARLRANPALRTELVFVWADETVLLRRYTETRRRHPLSPNGRVSDGIAAEQGLTAELRERADLLIDTTDLPPHTLRRMIEDRYGPDSSDDPGPSLSLNLVSFAFPAGLPREADMVFDARFLRNPHYIPHLRPGTGKDADVAAFVAEDPDFRPFLENMTRLLDLVLPRFVQEGKKYATIAVGCTGGRHRSVLLIERLASHLSGAGWRVSVTHRELVREGPPRRRAGERESAGTVSDPAGMRMQGPDNTT